ncbi:hypothetical protein ACGFR6_08135 [Streptomyces sp. NPDC048567]|uniref:hypothetical protein n=1 Tax=Streptomyces sp. NPDC048567 TaxID=3365570 RepID=UPI0037189506
MALFAAFDGFRGSDPDALLVAALVLVAAAASQYFVRSRVHLRAAGVTVVNPLFWHEIPYSRLYKAEAGPGRGLALYLKDLPDEDSEIYVVGYAGSLLDRCFRTAETAAKAVNKAKKKNTGPKPQDPEPVRRGLVRDPVIETFLALAAGFVLASLTV